MILGGRYTIYTHFTAEETEATDKKWHQASNLDHLAPTLKMGKKI